MLNMFGCKVLKQEKSRAKTIDGLLRSSEN